jgi:hypothetical protein
VTLFEKLVFMAEPTRRRVRRRRRRWRLGGLLAGRLLGLDVFAPATASISRHGLGVTLAGRRADGRHDPIRRTGHAVRRRCRWTGTRGRPAAAAADGELWKIRVTSVPEPQQHPQYIEDALAMRAAGNRFAFAVLDSGHRQVLGSSSYHDILPAVKRVEIGYTWYAKSAASAATSTPRPSCC